MDQSDNVENNSDSDTSEEYAFFVGKENVTKFHQSISNLELILCQP